MEKSFWHSKKFWTAVIATAVPVLNHIFEIGLNQEAMIHVSAPLIAYILGQGLADLGKNTN